MDDPRLTPARGDLAAKYLEGKVKAKRFVDRRGIRNRRCARGPARDARFRRFAADAGAEGRARHDLRPQRRRVGPGASSHSDGYVGWLPDAALAKPSAAPTHKVTALRTFAFPGPSIKLPPVETLPLGAKVADRARRRRLRGDARRLVPAALPCRPDRRVRERFRRGRRTLRRHALSVGRQEQPWHRLLRPGAGRAERRRHRLPARQRHAAGRPRPGARCFGNDRNCCAAT